MSQQTAGVWQIFGSIEPIGKLGI